MFRRWARAAFDRPRTLRQCVSSAANVARSSLSKVAFLTHVQGLGAVLDATGRAHLAGGLGCRRSKVHDRGYLASVPVERPHIVDAAMEAYGQVRHEAALMLLDRLPVIEEALHDALR